MDPWLEHALVWLRDLAIFVLLLIVGSFVILFMEWVHWGIGL